MAITPVRTTSRMENGRMRDSNVSTFSFVADSSSVMDVVHAYERACGHEIPYVIAPRRDGDIAENYAACDKAAAELGWRAEYDLDRMCADSWHWQSNNPDGYGD